MAGMLSMKAAFVGRTGDSISLCTSGAHRQLVGVSPSARLKLSSNFAGQQLTRRDSVISRRRRSSTFPVKAKHGHPPVDPKFESVYILDDISRFLYRKASAAVSPYIPKDFDPLGWLPEGIHSRVHQGEAGALFVFREAFHLSFFYFLFCKVDSVCKFFNWLYVTKTQSKEVTKEEYEASSFKAMTAPMRLVILVWAATRLGHIAAPLLRLDFGIGQSAKTRASGLIVAVTWFFFRWKKSYVGHLASTNKLDAPRIIAFDKVVSLLMYFIAASCIGEVTGFALRSLLAVGGFSGFALGLASKEVVSNFFGGALLFITRPFVIGERIRAGQCYGYVQDIGFLQTKILSIERVPMIVPNQNFINQVITNYSRAANRFMEAEFPVRQKDIFLVDAITSNVAKYLRTHSEVDVTKAAPVCYLKSIHSSDIIISVSCVLRPCGGSEFYKLQQTILVAIADIINAQGASLAG